MKNERVIRAAFVGLLAAACTSPRSAAPPAPETAEIEVGSQLAKVERPGLSFADAIRVAAAGRSGFTAVAAGVDEGAQSGTRYDVALLSHGRVQEISIDAATGNLSTNEEHPVLAGHEKYAAMLEEMLPSATIDLSRAVEIALVRGEGARPLGAQIDIEDDHLVYRTTVAAGGEWIEISVDPESGEVLRTESGEDAEGDEPEGAEYGEDFEDVPDGGLPAGWKIEATGSAAELATWSVVPDPTSLSKGHALALTSTNHGSASTFNLCWTDWIRFQDGVIEASMKPMSGREDEGGGLVWRVQGKDDYYVCRANPLEGNFRVYCVKAGQRHELAGTEVDVSAGAWHRIRVEQEGEHIVCSFDGEKLLDTIDATFPGAGGIGFWTKADAVTSFDDLVVSSSRDAR